MYSGCTAVRCLKLATLHDRVRGKIRHCAIVTSADMSSERNYIITSHLSSLPVRDTFRHFI